MQETLASYVRRFHDRLVPAFVEPQGYAALEALAARIPAAMANSLVFEASLWRRRPTVDFSIGIPGRQDGIAQLATRDPIGRAPVWLRLKAWAERWSDTPTWRQSIGGLWLEFDNSTFEPSLFFLWPPSGSDSVHTLPVLLDGAFELLGKVIDVGHVQRHVPPGSTVTYVGAALGRPEAGIRLCQHSPGSVEEFLKAVSWPGSLAGAGADVPGMLNFADGAVAVITVADAIGERVGLELYCRGEDAPRRQDVMVAELIERGWCEPAFAGAIRKWRGGVQESDPWPKNLAARRAMLGPRAQCTLNSALSHIKLSVTRDRLEDVKAYIWMGPIWRFARPVTV